MVFNMSPVLKRVNEKNREFVGLRVTTDEKERIAELAEAAGQSITEFVRSALVAHMEKQERAKSRKGKRR